MTVTITYDGGPVMTPMIARTPSYEAEAEPRTVAHDTLDGDPVYTLRPASADAGTLELIFPDEATARDCYTAHKIAAVFTITDDSGDLLNFDYVVVGGRPRIGIDPQNRRRWIVTVPYQEAT